MAKRGHMEGTFTQLPSGKWRVQIMVDGHRMGVTRPTRRECQDWLKTTVQQIDQGITYDAAQTTVGDYMAGWLANKATTNRIQTNEQYQRIARLYIYPKMGYLKLKDLTPGRVQAFYDELLAGGTGERTIEVVHTVLHGALRQALRLGLIPRNPAQAAIVPRPKRSEMQVWTESQVSTFLLFIRGHRLEILYQLALATGMRRGELVGLQWDDVDWTGRTIRVQRQVCVPEGGGFIFQEPKSRSGVRAVQVGPGIIERLREQQTKVDQLRQAAGARWQEYNLIFPSGVGTPMNGFNVSRIFREQVDAAGLPPIRFHDTRHTAASLMLTHGIPAIIVAGILGHSLAVLHDRYAHFIPSSQETAADLMDGLTRLHTIAHEKAPSPENSRGKGPI